MFAKRFIHAFLAVVLAWIYAAPQVSRAGIITTTDVLPPFGQYRGDSDGFFSLLLGSSTLIVGIKNAAHVPVGILPQDPSDICPPPSPGCVPTMPRAPGYVEIETFTSRATFDVQIDGSNVPTTIPNAEVIAKTKITVISVSPDGRKLNIDNELLSLRIDGTVVVLGSQIPFSLQVEEQNGELNDEMRRSKGMTTIEDIGIVPGQLFRIESFFDVFTELSINFGPFIDSQGSFRMTLVPEPATLLLLTGGLIGLAASRRKLRSQNGAK